MKKDIIKDRFLLSQKSSEATIEDYYIIDELKETLRYHQEQCLGMAANMIGYLKRIMIINHEGTFEILINPVVMSSSGKYHSQESCLCHQGTFDVTRYQKIKVSYLDEHFKKKIKTFQGLSAQIIQHEMDHFEGIIV